jgi:hypothetical protein
MSISMLGYDPAVVRQLLHLVPEIFAGRVDLKFLVMVVGDDADDRLDIVSVEYVFKRMKRVPVHRGADIIQSEDVLSAE